MIAVLAVCLAVAVIACVWLAARGNRTGRELGEALHSAAQLETQLTETQQARTRVDAELAGTRTDLEATRTERDESRRQLELARRTAGEADTARLEAEASARARAEGLRAAEERLAEMEQRAEATDAEVARVTLELGEARARLLAIEPPDGAGGETRSGGGWDRGPGPDTLWALELARTQRTWRTSVSADPTAQSFDDGGEPLRAAVEIDIAAIREESGVEIALVWDLDVAPAPAAALAVLRSAQELLAATTRMADDARLVVSRDGEDVVLDVTETDGSTGRFADLAGTIEGRGLAAADSGVRIVGAVPGDAE